MNELLLTINSHPDEYFNIILFFGAVVFAGTLGAKLIQRFRIPQVVGCILVGVVMGDVLGWIQPDTIDRLEPFMMFALGVIGFEIGGQLRGDVFKKYGRQFFIILFSQGIGAFVMAAAATAAVVYLLTGNVWVSIAVGLVLGAIASATAPAATVSVLWEYKTRGPLTAAVLAIVALDDALALLLYRGAATASEVLMGEGAGSVVATTAILFGEIAGAILLGFAAGVALRIILKFVRSEDKILGFSVGSLLLVVGVSIIPGVDPILPAMTFGITIANLAPRQSKSTFALVEKFSPPVYTAFFVLAGAHMEFGRLTGGVVAMIVAYLVFRAAGKMAGSWLGAKVSAAPAVVRNYLGLCLLPQAGVAIGLAILAGRQFAQQFDRMIIMVVMTGAFIMEIIGPVLVKVGVKKAGEVGLNVTEADLIKEYDVKDVMDTEAVRIPQDVPLEQILNIFSNTESVYYPVVDGESNIIGVITVADIKEMFANREVAGWLLACDVAEPVRDRLTPGQSLEDAIEHMERYNLETVPVVAEEGSEKLVGVLDRPKTLRKISAEVLQKRSLADGIPDEG